MASRIGLGALALLVVLLPWAGHRAALVGVATPREKQVTLGPAHLAQVPDSRLDPAPAPPQPLPPALTSGAALRAHEVFAFAPYWTLGEAASFPVSSLTTVAYFGVDVQSDGSLLRDGTGWAGYESQGWADLVNRAHAAGTRAVLTAKSFDGATLHALATNPGAADRLAADLTQAVRQRHLDGVNLDFEGTSGADRDGFTAFLQQVTADLHASNSHWQVTADTFASSASDGSGLLDVGALAKTVDAIFVMGYDLNRSGVASGISPLAGPGWNMQNTLDSYLAMAPPNKLILGLPFYGYDWPTDGEEPFAATTGGATALSYRQVMQLGGTHHWDAASAEPWISYQSGGSWHEVYYEDPRSLGMKAQYAVAKGVRGLGVWALGMDGGEPSMVQALLGKLPPVKLPAPIDLRGSTRPPLTPPTQRPVSSSSPSPVAIATPRPTPTSTGSGIPSPTPTPTPRPTTTPTPTPSPTRTITPPPSPSPSPTP